MFKSSFIYTELESLCYFVFSFFLYSSFLSFAAPDEITFLILSQENEYHRGIAEHLKQHIVEQAIRLQEQEVVSILSLSGAAEARSCAGQG